MPDRPDQRPDPFRIASLSVAIALHVALALALVLPVPPLRPAPADESGDIVFHTGVRQPPPPAPPAPQPPILSKSRPVRSIDKPDTAPASGVEQGEQEPPGWAFDPAAGVTLVVYGSPPDLQLEVPDQPPAELPVYRESFDPESIEGFDSKGAVTFDVLVEPDGSPSAIVITRQTGTERALETAIAVIGQWRFVPATRNGEYVQAWLEVSLEF